MRSAARTIVLPGSECETIVREDLFPGGAGRQEIQHVLDANAQPAVARTAAAQVRIHGDSVDGAHGQVLR